MQAFRSLASLFRRNVSQEVLAPNTVNSKLSSHAIQQPIVWIDCEMTGLDIYNDHIIEICCIITDQNLEIVDEGYESVIHFDNDVMSKMNDWCIEHHGQSGLTKKVLESTKTLPQVESELLSYISQRIEPNTGVMAGNSIHMDKFFMYREFPKVIDYLFYRLIDVSTIYEICKRHNPALLKSAPRKKAAHTAKADILESIQQLKWFQTHYLKSG
ncbi:BA75_03864T0 [Komagataella pastoris]|uniref:BA75_03864T0 n=1 Tax=Komagataella pastoris TaxID=4922 RepID=A0A1B2JFD8_PICPA|nr:BA75_03864T0 [Komagataella pastoris]